MNVVGGGIEEDHDHSDIDHFIRELGVYTGEIDDGDEDWQTPLGIETKAWIIRTQLER